MELSSDYKCLTINLIKTDIPSFHYFRISLHWEDCTYFAFFPLMFSDLTDHSYIIVLYFWAIYQKLGWKMFRRTGLGIISVVSDTRLLSGRQTGRQCCNIAGQQGGRLALMVGRFLSLILNVNCGMLWLCCISLWLRKDHYVSIPSQKNLRLTVLPQYIH